MAGSLGVKATPFTYAAHALAVAAATMVLVWCIHFRGGLAFEAVNKNLIFNVSLPSSASFFSSPSCNATAPSYRLMFASVASHVTVMWQLCEQRELLDACLHPVFMLIGYIIIGSEAIMIYKSIPGLNHDTAKLIHLILHAIAIVCGAFGIYCAFKNHNESGIANLYSLHSWLGIGAISLYGIQWIFGFITFFFPGAAPDVRRGALPWHALFGLFVYILTLATSQLGFLEKLTFLESSGAVEKYGPEALLVNFTALVVVLFGAAVVVAAVAPAAKVDEPEGYAAIPVIA
ncbi:unnamed protein product [Alopecurus aequalis]